MMAATEPVIEGGEVQLIPESKAAWNAFAEAGFLAAHYDFDQDGMQLPEIVLRTAMVYFNAANIATTGYPFLKEGLLAGLLSRTRGQVDVSPSLSPLQVILMAFDIDLTADLNIVDIDSLAPTHDQRGAHLMVTGVRNSILARKAAELVAQSAKK